MNTTTQRYAFLTPADNDSSDCPSITIHDIMIQQMSLRISSTT